MRALRTRLVIAVLAVVSIALVALIGGFNLVLQDRLSRDANEVLKARAAGVLASLTTTHGKLVRRDEPDQAALEGEAWVFNKSDRLLEGPGRSRPEIFRAAASLAGGPRRDLELADADVRLYAVPIVEEDGKRYGTVVAGLSLVPYEHTQHVALVASLIMVGMLLIVVALLSRWVVSLALRPVARMTAQADDWSEHDLDRRFALGRPHDELTTLAATLDNLLGRVAASLRREQRFSSELSHELRTPLARVRAEAELALRHERSDEGYRESLRRVLAGADQMERIIQTLLVVAREEASARHGTADADEAACRAAESCAGVAAAQGVEIDVSGGAPLRRVASDSDLVERILVPVIENACRYGRGRVTVTTGGYDGMVTYTVSDDGPGVSEAEADRIFEPGVRGSAAANGDGSGGDGAGLGLPLARRMARAVHGDVEAHPDEHGGRFTIVLPTV
jgi:two-component system, OmpR family, sensor kinase